jgi:hypothetical protein
MTLRTNRPLVLLLLLALGLILGLALTPAVQAQPDPLVGLALQQAELTGSDGASGDFFGSSVVLDGDTALVGAGYKTVSGRLDQGVAYVFTRSGGAWSQQAELTASDGAAGDYFGFSVALDGDTALIGASNKTVSAHLGQGAAYVFTRSGGAWSQQAELTGSDGAATDHFGQSVALNGDTALIGASFKTVGGNNAQGSAYVFTRIVGGWTQQAELTGSDGAGGDLFGYSVAVSGDTALVGARIKTVSGHGSQGAAYVFTRAAGVWSQQAELTGNDGATGDYFGQSVALDGDTALVGACYKAVSGHLSQGAAYVFTRSGSTWSQQAELTGSDGAADDNFGWSVALDGDGALVGAFFKTLNGNGSQGAAYAFSRSGGVWSQQAELSGSDGAATDYFAWSVSLGGRIAMVGAPAKTVSGHATQGAAYVFGLPCTVTPSVAGGHGTISPATAQTYDLGSTPTFIFTPDAGYVVGAVTVDGSAVAMTGTNQYTFPALAADHTISVAFVGKPAITKLSPKKAKRGKTVTVTGRDFGAKRSGGYVKFGKAKVRKYVSWTATSITVKVPKKAKFGKLKVTVTTTVGTSAGKRFKVLR